MTKKILLTGFGPFAKNQENISERIALELDKLSIDEYQVQSLILPVTYFGAPKLMQETIINLNPSIVVSLGLAAERKAINPELLGINFRHSNTADNDDYIAQFETISKDSKEAYYSTLPIKEIISKLKSKGYPIELSTDAGSYVCNTVLYSTLSFIEEKKLQIPCGFIHLPNQLNDQICFDAIKEVLNVLVKEYR